MVCAKFFYRILIVHKQRYLCKTAIKIAAVLCYKAVASILWNWNKNTDPGKPLKVGIGKVLEEENEKVGSYTQYCI